MVELVGLVVVVGAYAAVICAGLWLIGVATGGAVEDASPDAGRSAHREGTEPATDAIRNTRGDHGHPIAPTWHPRPRIGERRHHRRRGAGGGGGAHVPAHRR